MPILNRLFIFIAMMKQNYTLKSSISTRILLKDAFLADHRDIAECKIKFITICDIYIYILEWFRLLLDCCPICSVEEACLMILTSILRRHRYLLVIFTCIFLLILRWTIGRYKNGLLTLVLKPKIKTRLNTNYLTGLTNSKTTNITEQCKKFQILHLIFPYFPAYKRNYRLKFFFQNFIYDKN